MNVYLGPVLILVFLGITCLYSAFEKIFKWTDSLDYYIKLYDKELSPFLVKASIVSILLIEMVSLCSKHKNTLKTAYLRLKT